MNEFSSQGFHASVTFYHDPARMMKGEQLLWPGSRDKHFRGPVDMVSDTPPARAVAEQCHHRLAPDQYQHDNREKR